MPKPIKKSKPKLTLKEKGFIKDLITTKNPAEAVRRNYDIGSKGGKTGNSAYAIAFENLRKPKIQMILNQFGLTTEYLTEELKQAIDTSKNETAKLKGIELGYKLQGYLQGDSNTNKSILNIYNQYNQLDEKDLKEKLNTIENKLKQLNSITVDT